MDRMVNMGIDKVIIGLTPDTEEWRKAMKNANDAADPKQFIPVREWKRPRNESQKDST